MKSAQVEQKEMDPENEELGGEVKPENHSQERTTLMVVVKGRPSKGKSTIASLLVECHKYPLIDQDGIATTLQNTLPTSSTGKDLVNNLAFETVCGIAATQLSFKLGVVISTPLSRQAQFERMKKLASDSKAHMIVIECKSSPDDEEEEEDYYEFGGVLKLTLDPSKPLDPEKLIASTIRHAESGEFEPWKKLVNREEMLRHLHELDYFEESPKDLKNPICQKCRQSISSGPIYRCVECQGFILHKSCAELAGKNVHQIRENCPTQLSSANPEHKFPRTRTCQACELGDKGFSYDCFDCLIQTHLECGFLPTVLNSERHEHMLDFVITPLSFNYEYLCRACDDFGKSIGYKCYKCSYDLHVDCALVAPKTAVQMELDLDEELDARADNFIKRFKQQLKLQRMDSLLRYSEMLDKSSRGAR